ncbi:MAG: hypothetical protein ABSG68_15805 [Thermoguttaceae bacterium]|jgi:hypothetical protein
MRTRNDYQPIAKRLRQAAQRNRLPLREEKLWFWRVFGRLPPYSRL